MLKLSYSTLLYETDELTEAIQDCASAGYQGLEINSVFWGSNGGFEQEKIISLQKVLKKAGLEIAFIMIGWLDAPGILEDIGRTVCVAEKLGVKAVGILPPRRRRMSWTDFITVLERASRITRFYNADLVVHHHGGSMVEKPKEIELMLQAVPDAWLLFDVAHYFAFDNPLSGLEKYKYRIRYIHIKDMRIPKNFGYIVDEISNPPSNMDAMTSFGRCFTDLGKGVIKLQDVWNKLSEFYDGWVTVEIENLRMKRSEHAQYNMNYIADNFKL